MSHFEEDTPTANLVNREVVKLLFSYLFRYRSHLMKAIIFVAFITAARLLVPYISGFVVDRYLVKKGFTLSTAAIDRSPGRSDLAPLVPKSIRLNDSTVFLFQQQLSHFSAAEVARFKATGIVSKEMWLLVRSPQLSPAMQTKIAAGVQAGIIRSYGDTTLLFTDSATRAFTTREMVSLRRSDRNHICEFVLIVIALFLVQFIASYRQIIELMKLSQFAMRDLRADLFRHVLSLELSWFDRNPVGRLVNRVSNDIETLNEMFSTVVVALFQDLLIMAGIVVVMFLTDVRLALAVTASFPFLAVITVVFRSRARVAYRMIRTKIAHLNAFLNENITGMRIVQIFGREDRQRDRFSEINHDVYTANIRQLKVYAVFRPLIDFFRWGVVAGIIFFGAQAIVHATLSYGVIVMFLAYIANLFEPLGDLAEKFDTMQSANAAGEKILGVLKAPAVRELDSNPTLAIAPPLLPSLPGEGKRGRGRWGEVATPASDATELDPPASVGADPSRSDGAGLLRGEIRFDNVWTAYNADEWVLRGISFSVPPRSTLAIVGETGSGKSTIINLLGRFYPWQKGKITIGGVDLHEVPYSLLRSNMATVMQDMFLFSRTIEENLTLGKPFDQSRWDETVRVTHLGQLLKRLPAGNREMVMERGVTLSGGERQLCAFARALYADPAILVLDEATSSIDSETENLIQDALKNLVRNRTSIIIAHRLSTVRNADKIIVIDKGLIAEEGNHESLLERKGLYYELYKLQFGIV